MSINIEPGVYAEAAAQPENVPQSVENAAQAQENLVPVSALQAERRERQQLQETNKILQDHLELLRVNQMQQQAKPKTEFDSMSDDDVLTVGQAKKFVGEMQRATNAQTEELRMAQQYNDYNEVVKRYLPEAIKENPRIRDWIMKSESPHEQAYFLAKKSDAYIKDQVVNSRSPEAQRVANNMQKPGNLSAVGTSSSASNVSSFKTMSDQDFMKVVNKNLGYY